MAALCAATLWLAAGGFAADTTRKLFNLPADVAARSLKSFASQSGVEIMIRADLGRDIRTQPVKGEMTSREAINAMLQRTGLVADLDEKNGVFAVRRETEPEKNGQQAAQATPADRPRDFQKKNMTETPRTQEPMKRNRLLNTLAAALAVLLAPAVPADAQTAPPGTSPSSPPPEEKIIELSPFVVSTDRDIGYMAQNSLSGSRLNTDLKDVGSPISTYTSEFLEDLATTDTDELAKYMLNVEYVPIETGNNANILEDGRARPVLIRGLAARNHSVNFFTSELRQDHFATERIDLSRGANSILFGISSPGGMLNVTTKRARLEKDMVDLSLQIRSHRGRRAVFDINKVLVKDRFALRVAAVDQEFGSWRHHEYNDAERIFLTTKYRIAPKTELNVEWERGRTEGLKSRPFTANDAYSAWVESGSNITSEINPNLGTAGLGNNPYIVYDSETGELMNWRGKATSRLVTKEGFRTHVTDFDLLPKDAVLHGPGFGNKTDYSRTQAFLTHSFTERLNFELAASRTHYANFAARPAGNDSYTLRVDPNPTLPTGEPNPNAGRFYVEYLSVLTMPDYTEKDARMTLSYEHDFGKVFGRHRLAALYGRDQNEVFSRGNLREQLIVNPPNTNSPENGQNRIWRRTYLDLDGPSRNIVVGNFRDQSASGLTIAGPTAGQNDPSLPVVTEYLTSNPAGGLNDLNKIETRMAVLQSYFLNDRLVTIFGVRSDRQDHWDSFGTRLEPEGPFKLGRFTAQREEDPSSYKAENRTAAAVFHALPWLSFTYNRSNNSGLPVLAAQPTKTGTAPDPTGRSQDIGIKLDLFKRKLFVTALYFESSGTNSWESSSPFGHSQVNNVWQDLNDAGILEANGLALENVSIAGGAGKVFDSASKGYEVDLVANPTRGWRVMLNFSASEVVKTSIGDEWQAYLAANRDFWAQYPDVPFTGSNAATIGKMLEWFDDRVRRDFILPDGELARGQSKYRLNFRTNYRIHEGPLNGFSIGGGVRYRNGPVSRYAIDAATDTKTTFYGPDTVQTDLSIGYERTLKVLGKEGVRWSLQLNVNNVFNDTGIIDSVSSSQGVPLQYRLVAPREFILTSRLRF